MEYYHNYAMTIVFKQHGYEICDIEKIKYFVHFTTDLFETKRFFPIVKDINIIIYLHLEGTKKIKAQLCVFFREFLPDQWSVCGIKANNRRSPDGEVMLVHRLRRWPNNTSRVCWDIMYLVHSSAGPAQGGCDWVTSCVTFT